MLQLATQKIPNVEFQMNMNARDKKQFFSPLNPIFFLYVNSLLLDNERWKQADVPAEFQDLVDSISYGKIALPEKKAGGESSLSRLQIILMLHVNVLWQTFDRQNHYE